jgi:PIN domain nuclease of toxin-antitoxin system
MSDIVAVLDASAVLALIHREPGADSVASFIAAGTTALCAVNYCEVVGKLVDLRKDTTTIRAEMLAMGVQIVAFDDALAESAAELRTRTRQFSLSLGDRACLALAIRFKVPAITADRIWKSVEPHCKVELIR